MIILAPLVGAFYYEVSMFIKAVVVGVDIEAGTCKCRREYDGEILIDVAFAKPIGSDDSAPAPGNRVAIWDDGQQLWALFQLDRIGIKKGHKTPLTSSYAGGAETGAHSTLLGGASYSTHLSEGRIPGDKVLATRGGAIVAALLGGAVLLRASALAKILLSKVDDFVRIFSRNYARLSDSSSEVAVNPVGRPYTYREYYASQAASRAGTAAYKEMYGDVALADYSGLTWRVEGGLPESGEVLRRRSVDIPGIGRRLQEDTYLDGHTVLSIINADEHSLTETRTANSWRLEVAGASGQVDVVEIKPGSMLLSHTQGGEFKLELTNGGKLTLTGVSMEVNVPDTTWNGSIEVSEGNDVVIKTPGGDISVLKHSHPETGNDGPGHVHAIHDPIPSID